MDAKQELRLVGNELEDLETSMTVLHDAIDGNTCVDWTLLEKHLAEGVREAILLGELAMVDQVSEGIHDARRRLEKALESLETC